MNYEVEDINLDFCINEQTYLADYVWLDVNNKFRSKTKVMKITQEENRYEIYHYDVWNYDGSSTGQANVNNSEMLLYPVRVYRKPFTCDVIVYCENGRKENNGVILLNGQRQYFDTVLEENSELEPMFGLEQEFFLVDKKTLLPYGVEKTNGIVKTLINTIWNTCDNQYCGVGNIHPKVREFMNNIMNKSLDMELGLTGMNMEVAPSQCEFQVCGQGLDPCDDLIMLRYIMECETENYDFYVEYKPKPFKNYSGSGCHINFSTNIMRGEGGYDEITRCLDLMKTHKTDEHIEHYGKDNKYRLTGLNETSKWNEFTVGIGSRDKSIRIPNSVVENECGYFEDRRPGANIDPYEACMYLLKCCL